MIKFTERDVSPIHSHRSGRNIAPLSIGENDVGNYEQLRAVGIQFGGAYVRDVMENLAGYGFDSNDVGLSPIPGSLASTTASVPTLVQFLQAWLPGFVNVVSAARKIDKIVGVTTIGSWEDEQVVQGILEPTGNAPLYGDLTNIPLMSHNENFEWRNIIRFEAGAAVGRLEEARLARIRVNSGAVKRTQAKQALDIQRNRVGFYGFADGANRTYGFLNDPNLPAYVTVPNGAAGTPTWATKTFNEITADIRTWFAALQIQSMDRYDPESVESTMVLPMGVNQYLSVTQQVGGISVREWMRQTYPKCRIETAPELVDANAGASAAYLFAERVDDGVSTDNGNTFMQIVPSQFMALGVEKHAKSMLEDYANATAGVMLTRPYAVYRATGI